MVSKGYFKFFYFWEASSAVLRAFGARGDTCAGLIILMLGRGQSSWGLVWGGDADFRIKLENSCPKKSCASALSAIVPGPNTLIIIFKNYLYKIEGRVNINFFFTLHCP